MTKRGMGDQSGFTLVEMLVVLAITAIVFGISAFGLSVLKGRVTPARTAMAVVVLLNSVHDRVVATARPGSATVDLKHQVVRDDAGDNEVSIPDTFKLTVTIGQETVTDRQSLQIFFMPDGTSSGAEIVISDPAGRTARLKTNWLTGLTGLVDNGS